jgi:hypothetical protein
MTSTGQSIAIGHPFEDIWRNERVIIVDFSLQNEGDLEKLLEITPFATWIDRHKQRCRDIHTYSNRIEGSQRDGVLQKCLCQLLLRRAEMSSKEAFEDLFRDTLNEVGHIYSFSLYPLG